MGLVVEFRRDSKRIARLSQKKRKDDEQTTGQIIIFPGIRRERHEDYLEECDLDENVEEQEKKQRSLFDYFTTSDHQNM